MRLKNFQAFMYYLEEFLSYAQLQFDYKTGTFMLLNEEVNKNRRLTSETKGILAFPYNEETIDFFERNRKDENDEIRMSYFNILGDAKSATKLLNRMVSALAFRDDYTDETNPYKVIRKVSEKVFYSYNNRDIIWDKEMPKKRKFLKVPREVYTQGNLLVDENNIGFTEYKYDVETETLTFIDDISEKKHLFILKVNSNALQKELYKVVEYDLLKRDDEDFSLSSGMFQFDKEVIAIYTCMYKILELSYIPLKHYQTGNKITCEEFKVYIDKIITSFIRDKRKDYEDSLTLQKKEFAKEIQYILANE